MWFSFFNRFLGLILIFVINQLSFVCGLLESVPKSPPGTYTSYITAPVCRPHGEIQSPKTTNQVLGIVHYAIRAKLKVKAFGNRHSLTDIICTDGIAIDMGNFKETLRMNPDSTVTVSAGYTIRELGIFLHVHGRTLIGGPVYGGITIGGALGTGAHGSSLKYTTSISDQTVGLKIIDGHGIIRFISSPEDLRAFHVHLGLLGVILEARIATVPDFKLTGHNYVVSDEIFTNGVWETLVRTHDYICFYWFPSSKSAVVVQHTKVPTVIPGEAVTNVVPRTSMIFNAASVMGGEALQVANVFAGLQISELHTRGFFTKFNPGVNPYYTEDGITFKNPATGYRYLMQDSVCAGECLWDFAPFNISHMDNSMAIPMRDLPSVIATIKRILTESPAVFAQGIWLRFGKASNSLMAPNYGRETCYVEFFELRRTNWHETANVGISAFQAIMQTLAFSYDGRSHWGKSGLFYHSRQMLQRKLKSSGNYETFLAVRQGVDPYQIYMNDFGRRLLNASEKINIDPATTHCALQDNCICRSDYDCAPGQSCGRLFTVPYYPVCKNAVSVSNLQLNPHLQNTQFTSAIDYFRSVIFLSSIDQLVQ